MGKYVIDKTLEFCYGHRVWTQKLNGEYAADLQCACRHLHGHEGKVLVHLTSSSFPAKLDSTGMVTDFRHLEWLKKWINANVDHQFILDVSDPLFDKLIHGSSNEKLEQVHIPETNHVAGWKINLTNEIPGTPEYEYKEGFFIVNFVPTSENLSKWMAELVQVKMEPLNVKVEYIEWWETPKSRSIYYV
jgi:6-pyruvoyltetrahydropterin/6-carboxytetrahydropterin synthase